MSKGKNKQAKRHNAKYRAQTHLTLPAPAAMEVDHPAEAQPEAPTEAGPAPSNTPAPAATPAPVSLAALFTQVATDVPRLHDLLAPATRRTLLGTSRALMVAALRHFPITVNVPRRSTMLRVLAKLVGPQDTPFKAVLYYEGAEGPLRPTADQARALYEADRVRADVVPVDYEWYFNLALQSGLATLDASASTPAGLLRVAGLRICAQVDSCDCANCAPIGASPTEQKDNARLVRQLLEHPGVSAHLREVRVCHHKDSPALRKLVGVLGTAAPNVTKLEMMMCDLGDDGAVKLASQLKRMPHLEHLDVSQTGLGEAGAEAIFLALESSASLRTVIAGGNALGDGVYSLALLFGKCPKITTLGLAGCGLLAAPASTVMLDVVPSGKAECLDFSHNPLGDSGVKEVAVMMGGDSSLVELRVAGCGAKDGAIKALAEDLTNPKSRLRTLDLSRNAITDAGAKRLAQCLETTPHALRRIDLSRNAITAAGAVRLGQACGRNAALKDLVLVT